MKNAYYEATEQDAARYIADRNVVYIPHIQMNDLLRRTDYENTRNVYRCTFTKNTMAKPIKTRVNVFPNLNTIHIVVQERTYKMFLKYADNSQNTLPFEFTLPQEKTELNGIIFENFKHSIPDIDAIIDYKIDRIIHQDIKKIFNEYEDLPILCDNENKWYLTTDGKFDFHLEKMYVFE